MRPSMGVVKTPLSSEIVNIRRRIRALAESGAELVTIWNTYGNRGGATADFLIASVMPKTGIDIFQQLNELAKLKRQAIRFLLKERNALDRKLAKLGHTVGIGGKKRKA